ncbi:MAG: SurA N-terminal domain-containing protein [Treponema sp.]|jgi:parvulin-like peptidyl-prolyl isomerase|nr:SurA N-terminal domain-containing protein [Treponema sp.]
MASKEKKSLPEVEDSSKEELKRRFKAHPAIFIGTIVVLVIVVIAFVFVPAFVPGAGLGSSIDLIFGTYDKTPITYTPGGYFAQIRENITRNQQNAGQDISNPYLNYQIWRAAFEQTVVHTAILQEMKRIGYSIPDEVVDREVASLPQFQDNGKFSAIKYRQLDNASRAALWRQAQEELIKARYLSDMTGLRVSSKEALFIKAMASPERTFDMVAFPLEAYPESEIRAFASSNAALFQTVHLSKITVKASESEAKQVLENIQNGVATFEEAARTHSVDSSTSEKGGDMGVKMAFELTSEIPGAAEREAVIALAKGGISSIIKTDAGWTFFRAEEEPHPADVADAAVVQKIKAYIMDFERGRVEDWFIKQADAFAADSQTQDFDTVVSERELEKKQFGPVPLNYGSNQLLPPLDSSIPELSGAASNENFWQTAFSTPLNAVSKPIAVGANVLVLHPVEENPADETNAGYIESAYSSYWLSYVMEQKVNNHFITSDMLKDDFFTVYFKYFSSAF